MATPENGQTAEDWYVVSVSAAGVQVRGTREEAQETLNLLASTIQEFFQSRGITYVRRDQAVIRKPKDETDGAVVLNV